MVLYISILNALAAKMANSKRLDIGTTVETQKPIIDFLTRKYYRGTDVSSIVFQLRRQDCVRPLRISFFHSVDEFHLCIIRERLHSYLRYKI